jgi:alkanesulfonate monooxygenase SsuD/methylene tetrahydromethanopterin reductase-like flavin-dependent oxidoreductase (luciferase family)
MQFGIFDWVEASQRAPREVYEHTLALAAAAERAGFHGFFMAEHQGTPLSVDGSPAVLLSAMFQRTRRLRAGALTFCLPWYNGRPWIFFSRPAKASRSTTTAGITATATPSCT